MKYKYIDLFITFLIFLILIEIIPYIITILFPNLCYGCTNIGKIQQYLNVNIKLSYINWIAYIIVFMYAIYKSMKFKNKLLKYSSIFLCLFLIYLPTLPLLNIITILQSIVYVNPPFIKNYETVFSSSKLIEDNSDLIISEFKKYLSKEEPECIRKTNPGFIIENTNKSGTCWRVLLLKKSGVLINSLQEHFPNSLKLLKDEQIHNAFFSILDPGVEIPPHIGYYKGYLRYHLGVVIPNNNTGKEDDKAYIVCGNQKYIWREKEGIVFDDMYLHYVKNPTNQKRVVLYLDIKRKSNNIFMDTLNNIGIFLIENSIVLNTFLKNQHNQIGAKE